MEENNINFEEFDAALNDADDYQTDGAEETTETEVTEETAEDGAEQEEASEDGDDAEEEQDNGSEEGNQGNEPGAEQTFTIKVNKEERTVGLAEMTALAQKGADYDRVKDQLTESRNTVQDLQSKVDKYQGTMDVLEQIAAENDSTIEQLVEQLHVNLLMKSGKTEAEAKAEIRATTAERSLNALKQQHAQQQTAANDSKARAEREVAEFREQFPNVDLTEELCDKLMPDVQAGMSLTNAYRKQENARKDAEIADLQRQLAAEKQNKKNRVSSPGSQKDSGGRRAKSEFDSFEQALFG